MHTGTGTLILRNGRRLPFVYKFGSDHGDTRAGYLFCDTSDVDPAILCERMHVLCDDGTEVVVAVTHSSDRYLAITGRVAPKAAA